MKPCQDERGFILFPGLHPLSLLVPQLTMQMRNFNKDLSKNAPFLNAIFYTRFFSAFK
jgi:hypothetical protein